MSLRMSRIFLYEHPINHFSRIPNSKLQPRDWLQADLSETFTKVSYDDKTECEPTLITLWPQPEVKKTPWNICTNHIHMFTFCQAFSSFFSPSASCSVQKNQLPALISKLMTVQCLGQSSLQIRSSYINLHLRNDFIFTLETWNCTFMMVIICATIALAWKMCWVKMTIKPLNHPCTTVCLIQQIFKLFRDRQ